MTLSDAITATDSDNTTLVGAIVRFRGAFDAADILAASTVGTSITAVYDSGTGALTLLAPIVWRTTGRCSQA